MGWAAFLALAGSVAWRHPNVYLEFSGIAPPYLDPELIRYLNTPILADKEHFGTWLAAPTQGGQALSSPSCRQYRVIGRGHPRNDLTSLC